jgi:hypothetical protein
VRAGPPRGSCNLQVYPFEALLGAGLIDYRISIRSSKARRRWATPAAYSGPWITDTEPAQARPQEPRSQGTASLAPSQIRASRRLGSAIRVWTISSCTGARSVSATGRSPAVNLSTEL